MDAIRQLLLLRRLVVSRLLLFSESPSPAIAVSPYVSWATALIAHDRAFGCVRWILLLATCVAPSGLVDGGEGWWLMTCSLMCGRRRVVGLSYGCSLHPAHFFL